MEHPVTLTQAIYRALDAALTGPSEDPRRRSARSEDRLQYLTDAVEDAVRKQFSEPHVLRIVDRDNLLLGPFADHESAEKWLKQSIYSGLRYTNQKVVCPWPNHKRITPSGSAF